jgi:hypothetical protein
VFRDVADVERADCPIKVAAVEQDDRRSNEIEHGGSGLLILLPAITETAKSVEGDSARNRVARFAFVNFGSQLFT